jgi:hypothetical protein
VSSPEARGIHFIPRLGERATGGGAAACSGGRWQTARSGGGGVARGGEGGGARVAGKVGRVEEGARGAKTSGGDLQ